jgi:hypothetical protein
MTKPVKAVTPRVAASPAESEPESLDELRGDCARMAGRWKAGRRAAPAPERSAEIVDKMSDYGD